MLFKTMGNSLVNSDSGSIPANKIEFDLSEYMKQSTASFVQKYHANMNSNKIGLKLSIKNFILYQCLGSGAFAKVYLARQCGNEKKLFAIKILNKKKVVADHQRDHVFSEKRLLSSVNFPFLIKLNYNFHDPSYLYLVLEFMPGGELFTLLRHHLCFKETTARFYAAQIVLGLEYLHHLNIAYRDLKPENILIGIDGYLKIADFGFAKLVPNRTYTLCGTPEYLAPEIITSRGYSRSVDWWAFGVLVFELVAGYSPFFSEQTKHIYEKILVAKYTFPRNFSKEIRSLIGKLLEPDLTKRIGTLKSRVDDIKEQRWFRDHMDWSRLFEKKLCIPEEIRNHTFKRSINLGKITVLEIDPVDIYADIFAGF